ncbi:unnamed protein product, partial [Rotaria sp. Silwood1]
MRYGSQSSLFPLKPHGIFGFVIKYFQTLINRIKSLQL